MEWDAYIQYLLSSGTTFDKMTISLDEGRTETEIPPIVRASISILDSMIAHQGARNVIVFPEKMQSVFVFILMKLLHNIASGRIKGQYDPAAFQIGDKLKVGNALVEYRGLEEDNGEVRMKLRHADMESSAPLSFFPVFQRVSTKKRLSKYEPYVLARKKETAKLKINRSSGQMLADIAEMKTHMDSSIFVMTSVAGIREQLQHCRVAGKKVTDLFYAGKTDYSGTISNIGPGQMAGIPAIVFSPDLNDIKLAAEAQHPIQSVIIDCSNMSLLLDRLDVLDELLELSIPIVCITDIANSFELEPLSKREFNTWRWNKDNLTRKLYNTSSLALDRKTENCSKNSVIYLKSDGGEICDAMKTLAAHRRETQNQSPRVMKLFEKLNHLTFGVLRSVVPLFDFDLDLAHRTLDECDDLLNTESSYLPDKTCQDYRDVISHLRNVYRSGTVLNKVEALKKWLREHRNGHVLLVVPERAAKESIQNYWTDWCGQNPNAATITVLYPPEYYAWSAGRRDTTIVCGWLKRAIMRKILFSFQTEDNLVLLYDYENRWMRHDARRWSKALESTGNREIIEKSLSRDKLIVSEIRYVEPEKHPEQNEPEEPDELGEVELIVRENRYHQYISSGSSGGNSTVPAVPVSFVGGFLAFFRAGHSLVTVTDVILSGAETIQLKKPDKLRVGDFIAVRETDRDLVRELADYSLKKQGKEYLREVAGKWREALQIELLFCTKNELFKKMKAAGFEKRYETFRRWVDDEDVIAPGKKEDLRLLAVVTENQTILEMLDDIFEAARQLRVLHIDAGRTLSHALKKSLAQNLKKYGEIDPFNFWEPIEMDIENIGTAKVLKITDIGTEIQVDAADTNRLMEE